MAEESLVRGAAGDADGACFENRIERYRQRVDGVLARCLAAEPVSNPKLAEAMQYALLGPGKRVRPLLVYASAECLDIGLSDADAIAAAIEMIHTYSLIHDDLPAMDDDDLRRGRPTVHTAYDEATAILVGDGLQSLAFKVLVTPLVCDFDPSVGIALVRHLADASGPSGMVDGQALDIEFSGKTVTQQQLEDMFVRKTGRLIEASITMPLECATTVSANARESLRQFARDVGLCFQICDDILDVSATTEQMGKPSGSDVRNDRAAYPARFGLTVARARANSLYRDAMDSLEGFGDGAEGLRWLSNFIVRRDH